MSLVHPLSAPRQLALKRAVLGLAALGLFANAVFMLSDPFGWYNTIDGVPDTGAFNPHFVRDVGVAYLSLALMTAAAARWLWAAVPLLASVTLFLGLHALLHVWDIAAGRLDAEHFLIDAPGVFAPVIVTALLAYWLRNDRA